MTLHEIVRPKRLLAVHRFAREYIIVVVGISALATPTQQVFRHVGIQWSRLGRSLSFTIAYDLVPDGACQLSSKISKIYILPTQGQEFAYRKPGSSVQQCQSPLSDA
jgi:hypothetical protein